MFIEPSVSQYSKTILEFLNSIKSMINKSSAIISIDEEVNNDIVIKIVFLILWLFTDNDLEKVSNYFKKQLFYLDKKDYLSQNYNK